MIAQLLALLKGLPKEELAKLDFEGFNPSSIDQDLGTAWGRPGYGTPNASGTMSGDAWLNDIAEGNRPYQSGNMQRPGMPSDEAVMPAPQQGPSLDMIAGMGSARPSGISQQAVNGTPGFKDVSGNAQQNLQALMKMSLAGGQPAPMQMPQAQPPQRRLMQPAPMPYGGFLGPVAPRQQGLLGASSAYQRGLRQRS